MSHEVENMFYVGQTPWHGLGIKLEAAPTTREAIVAAGLDWTVGLKALQTVDGVAVSHRATYRESDGSILGVVGPTWRPLQNAEAFSFFDPFVTSGEARLDTAGSLSEGRRVWILAQLNKDPSVIVPRSDDVVRKFVLLSNSHDGSLAIKVGFTPIRVVCANTLAMAHDSRKSNLLRIRHTKNSVDALEAVRDAMNLVNQAFEATADQYRFLASKGVVEADLKAYVNRVFAPNRVAENAAAKRKTGLVLATAPVVHEAEFIEDDVLGADELKSRVYPRVRQLFENGRGNALPGVAGTFWGAYNAIAEYLAYERGSDAGKRLNESWLGSGAALNARALRVGVEMAQAA
jgi:phage/plasmid-like protein (TIGR03299 family)